eukprot:scaffold3079_cov237-Chaetoceros_neogracile.AAC.4
MKFAQSLFLLLTTCAHVADSHKMELIGDKEVPSVISDVTGTADFTLADDGLSMDFEIVLSNPSGIGVFGAAGAHIHCGGAGENGEVVLALAGAVADTSADILITGTLTGADVFDNTSDCKSDIAGFYADILLGRAYVNVHSTENGSGEVRGQYDVELIEVNLVGENEVPMVTSDASGTVIFTKHGILEAMLEIDNPSGIDFYGAGVHIHCGGIGETGPVVVSLVAGGSGFTSEALTSEIMLTDADVVSTECGSTISEVMTKLKLGEAYVNAHSEENPSGEIRGTANGAATFPLSGEYEVPSVDSSVTGTATFANSTGMLKFEIEIINPLERKIFGAAGAHIHCGGPDEAGPVAAFMVAELAGGNDAKMITETGLLTDDDVIDEGCGATIDELTASIYEGTAYVNVHSPMFPGGVTRGQVGVPSDDEPDDSGSSVLTSGGFGVIFSVAALMVAI